MIEVLVLYFKHIFAFLFLNSVETQIQIQLCWHCVGINQYYLTNEVTAKD